MSRKFNIRLDGVVGGIILIALSTPSSAHGQQWQASAQWHRILRKAVPGTLVLNDEGVEFRAAKFPQSWKYIEIRSFNLSARDLTIIDYQNRPRHEPGERSIHFTWTDPMPPDVAAQFAERVGKPVLNGLPLPSVAILSEIPARHRKWTGGSNGILRLKNTGVDYVTENGHDSRTWRWSDIQTLANPNPFELRIEGYREIFEFDLKQPLPRTVFEQMWDRLYAADLNLSVGRAGAHR